MAALSRGDTSRRFGAAVDRGRDGKCHKQPRIARHCSVARQPQNVGDERICRAANGAPKALVVEYTVLLVLGLQKAQLTPSIVAQSRRPRLSQTWADTRRANSIATRAQSP